MTNNFYVFSSPLDPIHSSILYCICSELHASNFDVELDSFAERVPIFENVTFTNIIARLNPNAKKFLALACHYDSKYFPDEVFYAATDSAVPCSIMLNIVKTLNTTLDLMRTRDDVSLMVRTQAVFYLGVFLWIQFCLSISVSFLRRRRSVQRLDIDRFPVWFTAFGIEMVTDTLSGPGFSASGWHRDSGSLGFDWCTESQVFKFLPKYRDIAFPTDWHRKIFAFKEIDHQPKSNVLAASFLRLHRWWSSTIFGKKYVSDPNTLVPEFYLKFIFLLSLADVPILHIIPSPFPKVWHKTTDNLENLSLPTIKNFIRILRVFVVDYFTVHEPTTSFRGWEMYLWISFWTLTKSSTQYTYSMLQIYISIK